MKKRLIMIVLAAFMIFQFTGCQMNINIKLIEAIQDQRLQVAVECVDAGADINYEFLRFGRGYVPILAAINNKSDNILKYLLQKGADVNYVDTWGIPVYMYTAGAPQKGKLQYRGIDYLKLCLDYGADINLVSKDGYNVMDYAAPWSDMDIIRLLLEKGAKVTPNTLGRIVQKDRSQDDYLAAIRLILEETLKAGYPSNLSPAFEAAILGHSEQVIEFINQNQIPQEEEKNVVRFTAAYGSTEAMKLLYDKGIVLNTGLENVTLLYIASQYGNLDIVKYLIAKGTPVAQKRIRDGLNRELDLAVAYNQYDVAEYLIEQGSDFLPIEDGFSVLDPLSIAAKNGNIKMMQLLVQHGYPFTDKEMYYAAEEAISYNQIDIVRYLLEQGLDPNYSSNIIVMTNLESACNLGYIDIVELFVDYGADVNGAGVAGAPLYFASSSGHTEVVKLLLEKGADPNMFQKYEDGSVGEPPIKRAIAYCCFDIIKLLVEHGANVDKKIVSYARNYGSETINDYLLNAAKA